MSDRRRRGRLPRIPNSPATERIEFRLTKTERADLDAVAAENRAKVAELVRSAVNEYVADYRERAVFRSAARCNTNSVR